MLRSGARHPDAEEQCPSPVASTSTSATDTSDALDIQHLYATLNEYLQLEPKFQPRLCLPDDAESGEGEVSIGARDGAAHVLRCLNVWYDLPPDVLVHAVSLLDRFLTKMKVRPSHMPCITVSCMNIALDEYALQSKQERTVSIEQLVSVSSSSCTCRDVSRMSHVIVDKLSSVGGGVGGVVTVAHWLRLFTRLVAAELPIQQLCQESELLNLLEIAICDATCANARTSELALVLLYHKLELKLAEWSVREGGAPLPEEVYALFDVAAQLQTYCRMSDASLVSTRDRIRYVLARYEARAAAPQRQRLLWRLSERTLKVLRPTDRLTSLLPTIEEQHYAVDATPTRKRSSSVSSENDTSDWPCSPVLPVYCDN